MPHIIQAPISSMRSTGRRHRPGCTGHRFRNGAFAVKHLFPTSDHCDTILRSRSLGACGKLYPLRRGSGAPGAITAPAQGWAIATPPGLETATGSSSRCSRSCWRTDWRRSRPTVGVVTLTAIWPACGRRRRRLCNGRHLPPLSHRVAPELAECSAGDQMALDVEEVVDGRMDGEEPLRGRGRFEPLHLSLSSSHRLM